MPVLYAMCGLAFSGKSTFAARLAARFGIERISLDDINTARGLHGGRGMTDAQWEETSAIAVESLGKLLSSGQSVVLDDTLSHRFLRDRYRKVAASFGATFVLVFMDTAMAEIEARMARNRQSRVRQGIRRSVFDAHRDRFQFPTADEHPVRFTCGADIDKWLEANAPEVD